MPPDGNKVDISTNHINYNKSFKIVITNNIYAIEEI